MNGKQFNLGGKFSRKLKMGKIFFFILLFCSCFSQANEYFINENFISLGQNPVRNSDPLSLLSCGHKVRVEELSQEWKTVRVALVGRALRRLIPVGVAGQAKT